MMHRLKPQIGPGRELGLGWRGAVFPLPLVVQRCQPRPFRSIGPAMQRVPALPFHVCNSGHGMGMAGHKPCAQIWIASIASSSFGPII